MDQQNWQLNSETVIAVDASIERLWAVLTDTEDASRCFMGARVTVGNVGEAYRLEREDGWGVAGVVLAKDAPRRLRVTWGLKTPPGVTMPNCEVEYVIEPAAARDASPRLQLSIREYVDGPVPPPLAQASRTGWAMIARNIKAKFA
ncbi:SRPBCC domain-containing protein [Bradyrhizobium prioriisuperbiae]|uniref:SRPBCC domain-containing protein n=1 Tax=Bradyrhizobium prioriisuperbiae TaxID=2854389 RepID=UPI0028EB48A4|nr:SRPBCC domain-containing protein [Bradyrhizobium prioritasuperba]